NWFGHTTDCWLLHHHHHQHQHRHIHTHTQIYNVRFDWIRSAFDFVLLDNTSLCPMVRHVVVHSFRLANELG
ncbi:hypothetical protein RDWZM_006291, partial [Blomia tropicalis]